MDIESAIRDTEDLEFLLGQQMNEGASSWSPTMMSKYLRGEFEPESGSVLRRTDGIALLYAGRVHSIHGESESGKSWLALIATAEVLASGGRVTYLDYESDAQTIADRLTLLGAKPEDIEKRLWYSSPESAPSMADPVFATLLGRKTELCVIDGANAAMATCGSIETKDTDAVTRWFAIMPRAIARATGAAVLLIDHVTKNRESRGRFAIGSQAKMAALDGAAYICEPIEALSPGKVGKIELRIGKDRPGGVRTHCSGYSPADRTQLAARITIDSTGAAMVVTVAAPDISEPGAGLMGPRSTMREILAVLLTTDGLGTVAIRKEVEGRNAIISEAIRYLIQEGDIEPRKTGKKVAYFLTKKARESAQPVPVPILSPSCPGQAVPCPLVPVT